MFNLIKKITFKKAIIALWLFYLISYFLTFIILICIAIWENNVKFALLSLIPAGLFILNYPCKKRK